MHNIVVFCPRVCSSLLRQLETKTKLTVSVLSPRVCCLPPTYGDAHAQGIKAVISLPWISSGGYFPLYSLPQSQRITQEASPLSSLSSRENLNRCVCCCPLEVQQTRNIRSGEFGHKAFRKQILVFSFLFVVIRHPNQFSMYLRVASGVIRVVLRADRLENLLDVWLACRELWCC